MTSTIRVTVPSGTPTAPVERFLHQVLSTRTAVERIAEVMEQQQAALGPATVAQLANVEELWRRLIERYGTYTAADIATLRGAKTTTRSVASSLARRHGLLSVTRARAKHYPRFQFQGSAVHPLWSAVSEPLLAAGWEGEDVLLWMVSPHPVLDGREPAEVLSGPEPERLLAVVEREALGVA